MVLTWVWSETLDIDDAYFGSSVSSAGDVNGDGYDDLIVGGTGAFGRGAGRADVYLGSPSGPTTPAVWTAFSEQVHDYFGSAVAPAGDVNGDGFDDVLVGTAAWEGDENEEGRAYLYLGSASGTQDSAAWIAASDQFDAYFGSAIDSAGDVNGDGYDDVLVGAFRYDGLAVDGGRALVYLGSSSGLGMSPAWTAESQQVEGWFGSSVASAGDVNGDGYGDVVVGAAMYDGGEIDEGRAFVFLGSPAGLESAPSWVAESNQEAARFGSSVASAGDVNGDGFSDVVIGAFFYDQGEEDEGRVWVFLGGSAGLADTAAWSAESNEEDAWFGYEVAGCGDVDADGFDDIVVSAPLSNDVGISEGSVHVFLGSPTGLSSAPAWSEQADQDFAGMGFAVASAGDIDADGAADLVVGTPGYDDPEFEEGRVDVFRGVMSGPDSDGDGVPDERDQCLGDDASGDGDGDGACATTIDGEVLDCDDGDPGAYPGASEHCDGVDNACAGAVSVDEADVDSDGVFPCAGDCDDASASANPLLPEVCGDSVDNDCSGIIDEAAVCPPDGASPTPTGSECGCRAAGAHPVLVAGFAALLVALRRRRTRRYSSRDATSS